MTKPRKAKTHFVPRAVYRTAFAGVVPICVAGLACGGSTGSSSDGGDDGGQDVYMNGAVGCTGFCGVAQIGFDSGPMDGGNATDGDAAQDAKDEGPPIFTVACSFAQCGVGVQAFADGGDSG
jgi:hypothetical protein